MVAIFIQMFDQIDRRQEFAKRRAQVEAEVGAWRRAGSGCTGCLQQMRH